MTYLVHECERQENGDNRAVPCGVSVRSLAGAQLPEGCSWEQASYRLAWYPYVNSETDELGGTDHLSYGDLTTWDGTEAVLGILLPVGYSDYSGSLIDVANQAYLVDTYTPDVFACVTGDYCSRTLLIPWELDACDAAPILDDMGRLFDYPLLDEERYSQLETDLVERSIVDYLARELRHELNPYGAAVGTFSDQDVSDAYWQATSDGCDPAYAEDTTYVAWPDSTLEAMRDILRVLVTSRQTVSPTA